jgi:hypothetical protein
MVTMGIRKVSLPPAMKTQLEDFAWKNRKSVSLVIREILDDYRENPTAYKSLPDMDGALSSTLTVYVPDSQWMAARDTAYAQGRAALSVVIRKGIRQRLEADAIPKTA